jgi:hypothetical protein
LGFHVTAIDLLQENAEILKCIASMNKLSIVAHGQNAALPWPIVDLSLDIAIDVFCYKHIVDIELQGAYRRSLHRTLKNSGFYFLSLASVNDGFYGPLLDSSQDPQNKLILDPYSNIPSFLYTIDDITAEFSDFFEVIDIKENASSSPMYGKQYDRKVINCILKKRH